MAKKETPRYSIKIIDKGNNEWWFNGFNFEGYALKGRINKYHTNNVKAKKIKAFLEHSFEQFTEIKVVRKKDYLDNDIVDTINAVNEVNLAFLNEKAEGENEE